MDSLSGTYSELVRATTQAESLERAANNEIVAYLVDDDAIAVRAAHPSVRLFTYCLQRLLQPSVAATWDAYAGAGAEAGYIHHSGVRRRIANGWYVMNMGHQPYIDWQIQGTIKALLGTVYGLPGQHPGLVMDGALIDLTLWYPAFDHQPGLDLAHSPYEEILISDEYASTGDAYQTACRNAFIATQNAITAAYPGKVVYPNFGDLGFCAATDANTLAIIAACSVIEAQQALSYTNGEPNLNATACTVSWATLASMAGKDVLAHGLLITPQDQASKDRAKIGVCAWFQMAARSGIYARFATDTDDVTDILLWEQPNLLHLATSMLGGAVAPYEIVPGSWTKGVLYKRAFANGEAYLFVRKAGQTGSDTATIAATGRAAMMADGTFAPAVESITLTLGQGALLLDATIGDDMTEPTRWLLRQYVHAALGSVDVDKYWNVTRHVFWGHRPIEQIQGDLETVAFSHQIDDGQTNEEEQLPDLDRAITTLSVKGYKKTPWQQESDRNKMEQEAERLLQDSGRAILWNRGVGPGMQCNASRASVLSQKTHLPEGMPGWVESELILQVYHDQGYMDP